MVFTIHCKSNMKTAGTCRWERWESAKLLRLCVWFTVRWIPAVVSVLLQCGYSPFPFSDVFCYVMESFKMYQDVIQHGVLIGFWHCTSIKWIPPENQKRLSDESVEVWHIETFTSLEFFSVKLFYCGEVCGRSAATGTFWLPSFAVWGAL